MSKSPNQRIYPQTGRILLDGGLNNKFERSIIADNESPACANVIFSNGAVETRQGTSKLNSVAIGSYVIDGLYTRRDRSGSESMIAFAGGTAWVLGTTTFTTISSAQSVFTAGIRVGTAQMENHIFAGNGGVIPYKYNGTAWTRHGVYAPTATATVASAAGSALPSGAVVSYKVTYRNTALVESDLGPAVTHTVAVNSAGAVSLSAIPTAPQSYGVDARRIYRTANGGSTYKLLTTISDNTTTTYSDTTPDASLGATAPTDNGVPPQYAFIVYHQSRLWMNDPSNPSYVWYTNLNEPYTVSSTNFIVIGDDASDLVTGLAVYDNNLLVTCEKSQWIIYLASTTASDWKVVRVKSAYGSKSPFCFLDFDNKCLFPANLNGNFVGMAAIDGNTVAPSSTFLTTSSAGSELQSDRIEPDMFLVQRSYLGNITGIVHKNRAYITVTYGAGQTTNNRIYVMDFSISNLTKSQKASWVPWTGLNAAQFTVYGGSLYYGSSTANGFVYQMETGSYIDVATAIDSYFWTKEFGGYKQDLNFHKDFRFANLLVEKAGAYYMTVYQRTNSDIGDGTAQQLSLDPGGSLWGVLEWGTDTWGGGTSQEDIQLDLGSAAGKRIQFKFTNQNAVNQRFKIHGMNFTYNLKGQR